MFTSKIWDQVILGDLKNALKKQNNTKKQQ